MHLGQRLAAQRPDGRQVLAQAAGFCSVPQAGTSSRAAICPSRTALAATAAASWMAGIRRAW